MSAHRACPIIVVHNGSPAYLKASLQKASESNAGGRVILLGDESNASIGIGEHHRHRDESLQADIPEFHALYQHLSSSQGFDFERFCIERWFLVRNFMRREQLSRCLVIDSDVLLFCDVPAESERLQNFAMTFGRWDAVRNLPHCNFIGCLQGIESFCDYVLETYRDPERLTRLKNANHKKLNQFWISDMSLFYDWASQGAFPIAMIDEPHEHGAFDSAIDSTGGYLRSGYLPGLIRQWKKIEFREGRPYAFLQADGQPVRMKCLHYHGVFKMLMETHARGKSENWSAAMTMLRQKLRRLPGKFSLFSRNYLLPLFQPRGSLSSAE